jgi:glycosyltransferase involved in cell wall biosynthesis
MAQDSSRDSNVDKSVVAVTAFACDPNIPSEPTIGWEFLRSIMLAAANEGDVEVVAFMNERSKIATDERLAKLGVERQVSTVGIKLPAILWFLKNPYLTRLEYLVWSHQTRRELQKLQSSRQVVLARHVTFASEILPTPISTLHGKCRTVWGPVGGLGQAGAVLVGPRHPRWRSQFALQRFRDVLSKIQSRNISRHVDVVLTTSRELADVIEDVGTSAIVFPNNTIDEELMSTINALRADREDEQKSLGDTQARSMTILCVGHLIYRKRFEIAINALRDPLLATARLVIIGKPSPGQENYLAPIAAHLGVSERVQFLGQLSRAEVLSHMFSADVLFHPASREGSPGVIGEATAVGIPVVCFAGTGASVVLDAAGTSGAKLLASRRLTNSQVARVIVRTAEMPRIHTSMWGRARYDHLESSLLRKALEEHADV